MDDAEQQLEFLSEIQQSIGKSAVRIKPFRKFLLKRFSISTFYHKIKRSHAQLKRPRFVFAIMPFSRRFARPNARKFNKENCLKVLILFALICGIVVLF